MSPSTVLLRTSIDVYKRQGCNYIFADSFGHEDYIIEAAKEFPEVQFSHATGTKAHTENLDNYHNAFASIYDGRYLAGVVAGTKLNEMIANGEITEDQAKICLLYTSGTGCMLLVFLHAPTEESVTADGLIYMREDTFMDGSIYYYQQAMGPLLCRFRTHWVNHCHQRRMSGHP